MSQKTEGGGVGLESVKITSIHFSRKSSKQSKIPKKKPPFSIMYNF